MQGVSQKVKKFKLNNKKTLSFFNLDFKLVEATTIQLSTVKFPFRKKISFWRYEA